MRLIFDYYTVEKKSKTEEIFCLLLCNCNYLYTAYKVKLLRFSKFVIGKMLLNKCQFRLLLLFSLCITARIHSQTSLIFKIELSFIIGKMLLNKYQFHLSLDCALNKLYTISSCGSFSFCAILQGYSQTSLIFKIV